MGTNITDNTIVFIIYISSNQWFTHLLSLHVLYWGGEVKDDAHY